MNRAVDAWERFWFAPRPTSSLALVRIAFGLVALAWTLSLLGNVGPFFSPHGLLPAPPVLSSVSWGAFQIADTTLMLWLVWGLTLLGSLGVLVGCFSRVSALLVLLGILSLERRNPYVFNAGDGLVRIIALYLVLAPAGAALSVDRWRKHREDFWAFPARAPWALRLMQIQLSIVYLSSVWEKLQGDTWPGGTALSYALRLDDLQRFPLPGLLSNAPVIVHLLTWGTLVTELACGTLVWVPRLRPYVLAAGAVFHVGIAYSLRVGFFSAAMLVLYVAFVPPERAAAVIGAVRARGLSLGEKIPRPRRPVV